MKKAPRPKRPPQEKLKGAALATFQELEARLKDRPNPHHTAGQLRLLDVGIGDYAVALPEVVLHLLDEAEGVSVADATQRAAAAGKTWQDHKATLELQLRLVRARALWEKGDAAGAGAQLTQICASPSSRRSELILEATSRTVPHWSPGFSLALLRAASGALSSSLPAALGLIDALTGVGEAAAAGLVLGQLIAGWAMFPTLTREQLAERIERLGGEQAAALTATLAAATAPGV